MAVTAPWAASQAVVLVQSAMLVSSLVLAKPDGTEHPKGLAAGRFVQD